MDRRAASSHPPDRHLTDMTPAFAARVLVCVLLLHDYLAPRVRVQELAGDLVIDREATRLYLCLQALIEIEMDEHKQLDEYVDSLKLMYDEDTLERSLDIISGKDNFSGLHSPGLSLDGFKMHKKLLDGYQKLHVAKQGNWPT